MTHRVLNWLSDTDTRLKVLFCYFVLCILPAVLYLYLLYLLPSNRILPYSVLYLVLVIVVQFPICGFLSDILAIRNLSAINRYCQKIKQGSYQVSLDLPPEKGKENDFIRVKRNLYWMGEILASREKKLITSLEELQSARKKIMGSLQYASRIQHTLLPTASVLERTFRDSFVWWEPRDVVGGDTYCVYPVPKGVFVAVIDCTGHGVPGAFMTCIVHAFLKQCLQSEHSDNPGRVLSLMNQRLRSFLHDTEGTNPINDGFDAAFCHIDANRGRMVFAGAGLPLYYSSDGDILEIKGDRPGVGDSRTALNASFTNHIIELDEASRFYLATDGIIDQIGGPTGLPFGKKRFKQLLGRIAHMPFSGQETELSAAWRDYAGNEEKRDDLTVLGFSVPSPRRNNADRQVETVL